MHEIKYVKPKLITTPKKPITFSERPDFFKRVRYVPNYFLYRYFDENICFAVFFASERSEKIGKPNFRVIILVYYTKEQNVIFLYGRKRKQESSLEFFYITQTNQPFHCFDYYYYVYSRQKIKQILNSRFHSVNFFLIKILTKEKICPVCSNERAPSTRLIEQQIALGSSPMGTYAVADVKVLSE